MNSPRRRPIRAAFLIDRLIQGGTETQVLITLQHLDRSRVEPCLCRLNDEGRIDSAAVPCPSFIVGTDSLRPPRSLLALARLVGWLRRNQIEVVVTFFRDANLYGVAAAQWLRIPVLSNRRNIGHWLSPLELRLLKLANRFTDRLAANSQAAKRVAVEQEGFPDERIEVIPNALELERFQKPGDGPRDESAPVFGCVANLRPLKDHRTLLNAFRIVVSKLPKVRLVLVGEGIERAALEQTVRENKMAESVSFLGDRDDVPQLLAGFDVGVLASRTESFPNAILEYLAAGLPVVSTAVGGTPEIVKPNVGRLVPPHDPSAMAEAMLELALDPDLRARMSAEARRRVAVEFSVEAVMDQWARLIENVVGARETQRRGAPGRPQEG